MCSSMSVDFIKNGKSRLDYCKKKLDDGRSRWESLQDFTKAYLTMATKLISFASQSIVIMQTSSYCDPKKYDQNVVNEKCKWKSTMNNLLTKTFDTQGRALFLSKAMQTLDTECSSAAAGWPFSQFCSKAKCDYKFALMLEKDTWERCFKNLNEEGKYVVLEEFRSDKTYIYCSNQAPSRKDGNHMEALLLLQTGSSGIGMCKAIAKKFQITFLISGMIICFERSMERFRILVSYRISRNVRRLLMMLVSGIHIRRLKDH